MPHFVNRRDIDFLLFELLKVSDLFVGTSLEHFDRDSISQILDTSERVAEKHFQPFAALMDANEPQFINGKVEIMPEVGDGLRAYAQTGLFAANIDESDGGLQFPYCVSALVNGIFSAANHSMVGYAMLTQGASAMLAATGSADQKQRFLPAMIEGRWFGTMCLSEPAAGSSLADIRTKAEPIGDGLYRLTGSKMWISGGDHDISENIVHMVLAKIPGGPPGVKGISLFIVPKYRVNEDGSLGEWNNVALAGLNHKMGQRGTTNCLLGFGENGDSIGWLVGEPHQGLRYMFHMMNEARIGVGLSAVALGLAGYLYSLDYARTRIQGRLPGGKDPLQAPVPIIEHADVKRMLLQQKAAVEGALALSAFCATLVDQRKLASAPETGAHLELLLDLLTPIAKSWASEHCLEANKLAMQILGGYGYTRDYPVERFYRDNRLNPIHEGTYAIHGIDLLGRKVRMQGGKAFALILDRFAETIETAANIPGLAGEADVLADACSVLQETTDRIIKAGDIDLELANATLYLDSFGTITIAWLWLWQAAVAMNAMDSAPASDRPFYEGKIETCRYFFNYQLPGAVQTLRLVQTLDSTCHEMKIENFIGA